MAGGVQSTDAGIFRFGQDSSVDYGDGVILYSITRLSPEEYGEEEVGALRFNQVKGPHTINLSDGRCLFDFYLDELSLLAGFRRVQSRLVKRQAADPRAARRRPNTARSR